MCNSSCPTNVTKYSLLSGQVLMVIFVKLLMHQSVAIYVNCDYTFLGIPLFNLLPIKTFLDTGMHCCFSPSLLLMI